MQEHTCGQKRPKCYFLFVIDGFSQADAPICASVASFTEQTDQKFVNPFIIANLIGNTCAMVTLICFDKQTWELMT